MKPRQADTSPRAGYKLNPRDLFRLSLVAVLIGAIYFLYENFGVSDVGYFYQSTTTSLFYWLYRRWLIDYTESLYSFSHLIPAIYLFLVWRLRKELAKLPARVSLTGLTLVICSFLLHWIGIKSEQSRISVLSLIGLLWSLPFFLRGWPTAKLLLFPSAFLIFSIPLKFFDAVSQPVRIAASVITSNLLVGLGADVSRSGTIITSNKVEGLVVNISSEHSGVFYVITCLSLSLLCSYLVNASWIRRIIIALSGLFFAVLANIVRGITVMSCGLLKGKEAAQALNVQGATIITAAIGIGGVLLITFLLRQPRRHVILEPHVPQEKARSLWPCLSAIALTLCAIWLIPANARVNFIGKAGVNHDLPSSIGLYRGGLLLFCHNPEHGGQFMDDAMKPGDPCPDCGEPLFELTPVEKALLPPDTLVRKYQYDIDNISRVMCSIVLSGEHRSSIHRPEVCLVDRHNIIEQSFIHPVDLGNSQTLDVKVLEMTHIRPGPNGTPVEYYSYYAYWFAGINRETPSHIERMIWMAYDRLFFSKSYRWAYISVAGHRRPQDRGYLKELNRFLKDAHPIMMDTGR